MRKIYFPLLLTVAVTTASCDRDLLDKNNPASISSSDVWKDPKLIGLYVNNVYARVPGWDYNTYNNISDEARSNYPGGPNSILVGQWNETSNPMDVWNTTYASIRIANDYFANIDGAKIDEATKKVYSAEVRFLRALFYHNLVKRYGGVPLITKAQSLKDSLLVARNTVDECFNFITTELDQAAADLPLTALRGRATKGAALALKSRNLLFYASPLFNPSNDLTRWQQAADAAKAVMDLNKYDVYPDLNRLWLDMSADHKETIFEVQYGLPEKYHGWDALVKPLYIANNDAGQCSPLQDLVDGFPMQNGKLINEPGSGYDPANPYANRDKRFYSFIAYNGSVVSGMQGSVLNKNYKLRIYLGGTDYDSIPSVAIYNTITGYFTIKATNPDNTLYNYGYGSTQPWIEMRYAEVLLNYAEAMNEASPGGAANASVYDALNKIRTRAGISPTLTPGALTQTALRTLIRNERYVELCFEGKRYWDLRRWKIADQVLNGKQLRGVVATKNPDGSFTYNFNVPVDPSPLVFDPAKMYLMPIPQAERTKNPKLTQNPGWPQ